MGGWGRGGGGGEGDIFTLITVFPFSCTLCSKNPSHFSYTSTGERERLQTTAIFGRNQGKAIYPKQKVFL